MSDPQAWTAIATLTALELVLGIDNIVLIAVVTGKLREDQRELARRIGLMLAMVLRVLLLLGLSWVLSLTAPLFAILGRDISGRDLILIGGGLFLLAKGVHEIHDKVEGHAAGASAGASMTMTAALLQIVALDVVFSIDSVITAIGMAEYTEVMVIAVVLSVLLMLVVAGTIGNFVERHPTVKMLALSFLLLIGVALIADGLGHHIPRGYIYFALVFSVLVEALNLRTARRPRDP